MFDLLVLGSGVAGLTTALLAAGRGLSVVVLTKAELEQSTTRYAQGGVAAALTGEDSPDIHLADTITAGAGICDLDAVRILVDEGPGRVRDLATLGAAFDAAPSGEWELAREGGHSVPRVVHAGGDATGAEVERALVAAVRAGSIEVREGWFAVDLIVERGRCGGVVALDSAGVTVDVRAVDTVLATGGAGQCFAVTTNPSISTGDGVALALRAGVACADLEFVQFHPTALAVDAMPRPLLSEAIRGEGAVLRSGDGRAFMAHEHPLADLAPRDIVSRAVHREMRDAETDNVWLDATSIPDFSKRFPTIYERCLEVGLDPGNDWLPVAPAAHYMSGGVVADLDGATTLPHLWVCGETACSGVHGANRLASNSLLEGLVFGPRIVAAIAAGKQAADESGAMRGILDLVDGRAPEPDPTAVPTADPVDPISLRTSIQRVMASECGVERDAGGLSRAVVMLTDLAVPAGDLPARHHATCETLNVLRVARAIVESAIARRESRGSHTRADYPEIDSSLGGRFFVAGPGHPTFVPLPAGVTPGVKQ